MAIKMPKEQWGVGPWQGEPDRLEWRRHGLPCLIVRGAHGALCGYVAVPPGHPLHGLSYHAPTCPDFAVHGGLTYAGGCDEHICHVPRPGEPDNVWWFGFDCAHCDDFCPRIAATLDAIDSVMPFHDADAIYRDVAYVAAEVNGLADQLQQWGTGHA